MKMLGNAGGETDLLKAFVAVCLEPNRYKEIVKVLEEAEQKASDASDKAFKDLTAAAAAQSAAEAANTGLSAREAAVSEREASQRKLAAGFEEARASFKTDVDNWKKAQDLAAARLKEREDNIADLQAVVEKQAEDQAATAVAFEKQRVALGERERLLGEKERALRATLDRFANIDG